MSEGLKPILMHLRDQQALSAQNLALAFEIILSGQATPSQIGAFLIGLETVGVGEAEIYAGAAALRANMVRVDMSVPCVDVCGTGGDGAHTLNISTAVSFVLAGTGLKVAKHGNRAMTSKSGAGDVLEALGVNLHVTPDIIAKSILDIGIGFMFAQAHHPAMGHVGGVRRELGFRTIFNLLGPLSNPAGAQRQLIGVYAPEKMLPMAQALDKLGCEAAWIVHGAGGLDEVSLSGPTKVIALRGGQIEHFEITPEDAGLERAPISDLRGGDAQHNARALTALLQGETGPYREAVLLNGAAALVAFERAKDLKEGVSIAAHAIDSGQANQALTDLVALTQGQANS